MDETMEKLEMAETMGDAELGSNGWADESAVHFLAHCIFLEGFNNRHVLISKKQLTTCRHVDLPTVLKGDIFCLPSASAGAVTK